MCVNQDSKLYWLTRHRKQASESDASVSDLTVASVQTIKSKV